MLRMIKMDKAMRDLVIQEEIIEKLMYNKIIPKDLSLEGLENFKGFGFDYQTITKEWLADKLNKILEDIEKATIENYRGNYVTCKKIIIKEFMEV